jgi:hypothetical protein
MAATFTDQPWNGAASRFKDSAAFCSACLIDENPSGQPKTQALCKLPVKEPDGRYNKNAIQAAAGALQGSRGGVQASADSKKSAARTLVRLMGEAKMQAGDGLKKLAQ